MQLKDNIKSWINIIDKVEIKNITDTLNVKYKKCSIYPKQSDVFNAFKYCNYYDLKVVMIGYDPYPQKDVATGLLFANKETTSENNISPSLDIIKECVTKEDIPYGNIDFDITLKSWAQQGVLLLNSALTVEENKIKSHILLWRPFMVSLLKNLSESNTGIIYVLFGNQAQTLEPYINKNFNYVIKEKHPAYYYRNNQQMPSYVFTEIDRICNNIYGEKVKWYKIRKV